MKSEFLTNNELFEAIENDNSENHFKIAANFLNDAITDWPTKIETEELLEELKKTIGDKLTYENIKTYLENINPIVDAWKIESISALIELFDLERRNIYDRTTELDSITADLAKHYREKE